MFENKQTCLSNSNFNMQLREAMCKNIRATAFWYNDNDIIEKLLFTAKNSLKALTFSWSMDAKLYCKIMEQIWRDMGTCQNLKFILVKFYIKQSLVCVCIYVYVCIFFSLTDKCNPSPNSTLNSEVKYRYIEYGSCCASLFTQFLLHHYKLFCTFCIMLTNTFVWGNMHTMENILVFMFV